MKHTPGSWKVVGRLIKSNGRGIVAKLPTISDGGAFSIQANSRLIGAGPEQHQMLIDLLLIMDSGGDARDLLESVRTLVAEVEGTD